MKSVEVLPSTHVCPVLQGVSVRQMLIITQVQFLARISPAPQVREHSARVYITGSQTDRGRDRETERQTDMSICRMRLNHDFPVNVI